MLWTAVVYNIFLKLKNFQTDILVHRRMQDSMVPGCYGVLNDEIKWKLAKKQADLTVFALDPRGAHAPFAPPWICRCGPLLAIRMLLNAWTCIQNYILACLSIKSMFQVLNIGTYLDWIRYK